MLYIGDWDSKMGLLATLDFWEKTKSTKEDDVSEVEYQLFSWGEIYPPFYGDREHSTVARHILGEYPFKLFSSSTPYEQLPQKLCLTFKTSHEINSNEAVKEFAAFLSLVSRRRVFPTKLTRVNGLPIEQDIYFYDRLHFQERQSLKVIQPEKIYQLLENLRRIDRRTANSFVLAMRLYHSATEIMHYEPELSYILLVTSLEAVSSGAYDDYGPESEVKFLDSRYPGWKQLSDNLPIELQPNLRQVLFRNERFIFGKLSKFVVENLPDVFWSEKEDDAKPDYITSLIETNGERFQRSDKTIQDYERMEKEKLKSVLRDVYNARSNFVHEGIRMPSSITIGLSRWVPSDALEDIFKAAHNSGTELKRPKLPLLPLLTFERLVSYSMVEFLRKQHARES